MLIKNGKFWLGDCLELMKDIPNGSVDMILCDLPYGTTACKWDTVIPFEPLWKQYWRIAKPNAAIVLFGSEPFSSHMRISCLDKFKYDWVWYKSKAMNFQQAKNSPLRKHEMVSIFSKGVVGHVSQTKKRMTYNPQNLTECSVFNQRKKQSKDEHNYQRDNGIVKGFIQTQTGYDDTVLQFGNEHNPPHPTQKPVALFEYLIKTYTNEGETVMDNCAGSGTTAVACENTKRKWICIEQLPEYYYPAVMRVAAL